MIAVAMGVFCGSLIIANYLQFLPELRFAAPSGEDLKQLNWTMIVLQALALIAGILFGHVHRVLMELRAQGIQTVEIRQLFGSLGKSTSFWTGLSAAPLIFGVVVVLTGPIPLGTALFVAFQNGFFWERVIPQAPVEVARAQ
jgi:hypothetical protein